MLITYRHTHFSMPNTQSRSPYSLECVSTPASYPCPLPLPSLPAISATYSFNSGALALAKRSSAATSCTLACYVSHGSSSLIMNYMFAPLAMRGVENFKEPNVSSLLQEEAMCRCIYNNVSSCRQLQNNSCLLYTSPSPRDRQKSRMPSSA